MPLNSENKFHSIMKQLMTEDRMIPGFNVYGIEDSLAIINAAEEIGSPVMLMLNKVALEITTADCWGEILVAIRKQAKVAVCIHLDHCTDFNILKHAIDNGFDSVMFDGSQLPLSENVKQTKEIADYAHNHNVLVEAEIGAVGYSDQKDSSHKSTLTSPDEAKVLAEESGLDWMAVSIGNVHRMKEQNAKIDFDLLRQIENKTHVPLVVHGSTGITDEDLLGMRKTKVAKVNIGTALRMVFGNSLRRQFELNPKEFERTKLFKEPLTDLGKCAQGKMNILGMRGFVTRVL
jgi:fructose-bisphosphate aldolase class II